MKNFSFTLLLFLITGFAYAQKPEPVYSFARMQKPLAWYKQQSAAWKKVTDKNPKDASAWYNYYYANRNLLFLDTTDSRPYEVRSEVVKQIVDQMGKKIPKSYEYHVIRWLNGGFAEDWSWLEKAARMAPDRTEHLDGMINKNELQRNIAERDKYALKKYNAGQISPGIMSYNYNTIIGLAPNAILFTVGDNDTYPIFVLQAQGIRKDIRTINLSLFMIDGYREKVLKEIGAEEWGSVWNNASMGPEEAVKKYREGIIKHVTANDKNYPVYVALTASGYTNNLQDQLYLTGLAYLYNVKPVDNIAQLKKSFEQLYRLDYVERTFYTDISEELVKQVNRNYIVPMLKLYEHYKAAGETSREAWMREKLLAVSTGTEDEQKVKKYIQ